MKTIRIGTRKSKLAVWQADYVANLLESDGFTTEKVLIETKGDKIQDVAIAKIGSKGVFTEELEAMLESGEVDIAVHSAKDLQSSLPGGFEIIAFSERAFIEDVIVSEKAIDLTSKSLVLGTSSTRRIAALKHFYPHIQTVDMRGNLQTRIAKMQSGVCDGLVLAHAGVHRMNYDHLIKVKLPVSEFIPPVGQGCIAVEAHQNLDTDKKSHIYHKVNNAVVEKQLRAERAYLKKLEGGCSIPVFAFATMSEDKILLKGGIFSLDGKIRIIHEVTGSNSEEVGISLADHVLGNGGLEVLREIKKRLG
ncbi:MAG: hydroxymethylbilane synthase [Cyclobacteriaceae bacterium]|nr:hydroxymethylbilane synthase [Cyclobacteriaceae bacterium SS2]